MRPLLAATITATVVTTSAHAQPHWPANLDVDLNYRNSAVLDAGNRWDVRLGAGLEHEPTYQGSDESETELSPILLVAYRGSWGNLFLAGDGLGYSRMLTDRLGIQLQLELEDTREVEDDERLAGLGDQDEELELEIGGRYFIGPYSLDAAVAFATGEKGVVWFVGGSRTWRAADDRLFVTLRADLSGSDEKNQQTDFGITPEQSDASGFPVYTPGGGLKSFGVGLGAEYQLSDRWFLHVDVDYERLLGDVADSPIVFDENNIEAAIGVLYRF